MKRFTTSAQKTLTIAKAVIVEHLTHAFPDHKFTLKKSNIHGVLMESHLCDGSKLVVAAFDKPGKQTLVMIDFQNIPADHDRSKVQVSLR